MSNFVKKTKDIKNKNNKIIDEIYNQKKEQLQLMK